MALFASFNGGPSEVAVQFAFAAAILSGAVAGVFFKRSWRLIGGGLIAPLVGGACLVAGNVGGDMAGLALVAALAICCPLFLLLGVVAAAVSAWTIGRLGY